MQETQPSWFAVYTKPRQEHIALENLERQGFRCFLPMAVNPYQRRSAKNLHIEPPRWSASGPSCKPAAQSRTTGNTPCGPCHPVCWRQAIPRNSPAASH